MITIADINKATTTTELDEIVEKAAFERNCELSTEMTYRETADFYSEDIDNESLCDMARILYAAESKWYSLEA